MQTPPQSQQLALVASRPLIWGGGGTSSNVPGMPGVAFFGAEFENLRSVSQAGSVVSSNPNRKRASSEPDAEEELAETPRTSTCPAPSWSPGNPPGVREETDHAEVTPLLEGARSPACPPPAEAAPSFPTSRGGSDTSGGRRKMSRSEEQDHRARTQAGLQSIMLG